MQRAAWGAVGAALSAAGIAGVLVGPRAAGPAYRIVGQRRLGRLRELVDGRLERLVAPEPEVAEGLAHLVEQGGHLA